MPGPSAAPVPSEKANDSGRATRGDPKNDDDRHHFGDEGHHFAGSAAQPPRSRCRLRWYSCHRVAMATVAQLIEQKGHNVESISPDATVYEAIQRMAEMGRM